MHMDEWWKAQGYVRPERLAEILLEGTQKELARDIENRKKALDTEEQNRRTAWSERESQLEAELDSKRDTAATLQIPAHPAATALALLLTRARRAGAVESAVATIFEPASEQGRRGMDELARLSPERPAWPDILQAQRLAAA